MPHRLSLTRMAALIRKRQLSSSELVAAHLTQIERLDGKLKAFVMRFPSEAAAAAIQADRERAEGPLHGTPVTVKDSFDMRDLPTLCGSQLRLAHRATRDSAVVTRLRAAGAIVLGKTNCPEFLSNYETDNAVTGWTANPWNTEHSAGGSSGGEAAAIASFCSAGGVGSDGGGSIRVPAHFCGITGLKPTPGRVSAAGHFPEISHPGGLLGVAGPMARTAEDLRLLFRVLEGYDPDDPFSAPVAKRAADLSSLRVGVMNEFAVMPEIAQAVAAAGQTLERMGIPVEPFRPAGLERAPDLWFFFFTELTAEFTREVLTGRRADAHWTGMEFVDSVPADRRITAREVIEALGERDRMRGHLLRQMETVPVLLTPACGVPAFRYRERRWTAGDREISLREAMAPATLFNVVGFPALVLPFGMSAEGLPIGIQLAGRPWEEEALLDLAVRLEEARGPAGKIQM